MDRGETKMRTIKWSKKDMVYEKLAHNTKPHYIEVARIIKEMEEKKKCTFHPQVNDDGRRFDDQQMVFERLFQERQMRSNLQDKREQIRVAKELFGCTFTPKRITVKDY